MSNYVLKMKKYVTKLSANSTQILNVYILKVILSYFKRFYVILAPLSNFKHSVFTNVSQKIFLLNSL